MSEQINAEEAENATAPPRQVRPPTAFARKWLRAFIRRFTSGGSENFKANRLTMVGVVAFIGFPLYGWIWMFAYPQPYENMLLRYVGMALTVPMLFARYVKNKKPLEIYANCALTYMGPFFFAFMFLMNDGSSVWSQSLLIATVALFQFNGRFATLAWLSGTTAAYLAFVAVTGHAGWPGAAILINIPINLFAILLVSVTKASRQILEEEKLNGMASALGSISHELRTPLLSVLASARGLRQYVPQLLDHYNRNIDSIPPDQRLSGQHFKMMLPAIDRIRTEVQNMNYAIDLLLANAGRQPDKPQLVEVFSVKKLIERTVIWYPFESEQARALVAVETHADFEVEANEKLMSMVIVNLLKNSLKAVARAKKGEIRIYIDGRAHGGGQIVVADTGSGIPQAQIAHIFTRFHSYPAHEGTGIGLAFCRETLAAWGAKISCQSVEGERCSFTLSFRAPHRGAPIPLRGGAPVHEAAHPGSLPDVRADAHVADAHVANAHVAK